MQVATGQIGQQPVPGGQQIQIPLSTLGRLSEVEQFEQDHRQGHARRPRHPHQGRGPRRARGEEPGHQLPRSTASRRSASPSSSSPTPTPSTRADVDPGQDGGAQDETSPRASTTRSATTRRRSSASRSTRSSRRSGRPSSWWPSVVLLFLQNWRSAIIPLVAVPVAIIGTFAAMAALGFSLNNLTLFGLVLAIGIVVDDAIVVVEAVEHHIEHGLAPREATIRAMDEVSGPVIAIGLVLDGGVRAVRLHQRDRGAVLPPVRPDDRRLHDHLRIQLPDAEPRAGGTRCCGRGSRDGEVDPLPRLAFALWRCGARLSVPRPIVGGSLARRRVSAATAGGARRGPTRRRAASLAASAIGLAAGALAGWLVGLAA